jgi:hypothetical protein
MYLKIAGERQEMRFIISSSEKDTVQELEREGTARQSERKQEFRILKQENMQGLGTMVCIPARKGQA